MMSQAMESVTRAFYARADLDLLLSSPAPTRARLLLAHRRDRAGHIAARAALLRPLHQRAGVSAAPRWLAAYRRRRRPGAFAAAARRGARPSCLFRTDRRPAHPRSSRRSWRRSSAPLFVIGVQAVSIFSYRQPVALRRFLISTGFRRHAARRRQPRLAPGARGDGRARPARRGARRRLRAPRARRSPPSPAASPRSPSLRPASRPSAVGSKPRAAAFRASPRAVLCGARNGRCSSAIPGSLSQTLMQVLYLMPPALFLWRATARRPAAWSSLVPVIVMAAGQLGGGLAWLAVSGEDAPDLVATAPVEPGLLRAARSRR